MLVLGSARIERVGSAPAAWSQELCAPEPLHGCDAGVLMGGWPVGYLYDRPGVSVMGKLALVEDLFRARAFLLDWVLMWAGLELLALAVARARSPT
jgi:hypothetical protein